jgi:acyl CoA:acetate/3-ketoacid CoA transferase beta subunit
MGTMPMLGALLARASFEPDLLVSDGEAYFVAGDLPLGATPQVVEGWIPFRSVFDTLWGGRRHAMMGASQLDRWGNQNIANIGPWAKPQVQLLGVRGGPGNTVPRDQRRGAQPHASSVRRGGRHGVGRRVSAGS